MANEFEYKPFVSAPEANAGRAEVERVVNGVISARHADDLEAALAYFAPDVVVFPPSTWSHTFYPRPIRGREAVREAMTWRLKQYELLPMTVHRLLIDADEAIIHRTIALRERGGGPALTYDCVTIVRVRDGMIVEWQEFPDGSAGKLVNWFPN